MRSFILLLVLVPAIIKAQVVTYQDEHLTITENNSVAHDVILDSVFTVVR